MGRKDGAKLPPQQSQSIFAIDEDASKSLTNPQIKRGCREDLMKCAAANARQPAMCKRGSVLTLEITLGAKIADRQSEDGQLVQLGDDALFEGEEAGQVVELPVEALPMPLARVAFGWLLVQRRLVAAKRRKSRSSLCL
jgi:hypothetical protein